MHMQTADYSRNAGIPAEGGVNPVGFRGVNYPERRGMNEY